MQIRRVLKAQSQKGKLRMDRSIKDADPRDLNVLIDNGEHPGFPSRQSYLIVNDILKLIADLFRGSDGFDAFFEIQSGDGAAGFLRLLLFLLSPLLQLLKREPAILLP